MSSKKKRNKPYKGGSASAQRPTITRVAAVSRNPAHQYWVDHKRLAKPVLIAAGIVIVLIITIIGVVGLIW